MGGTIFIESDDTEFVGVPVGAKHLYLVHRDTDGHEYVIRSGPSSSLWPFGTEIEVRAIELPLHAEEPRSEPVGAGDLGRWRRASGSRVALLVLR